MNLEGKKILLGITGSIAAYKSALLVRLLIKEGAEVRVVMTESSTEFISKLTLSVLSKNDVYTDIFENGSWHNHVELGLWADLMLIAPCTAVSLAKMANGISDNMLIATYLSCKCPVYFAPAMDLDMWKHPSTTANIATLQAYGNVLIDVESGELASGLSGPGRMSEPENIVNFLIQSTNRQEDFKNKTVLITAGPTYEHLDPVRFIGNYSSGKMGMYIAEEIASRGGNVSLVLGPSSITTTHQNITIYSVVSAQEMYEQCQKLYESSDIAIFTAAVADYRPKISSDVKIKKTGDDLKLDLVKNPDIAKEMGLLKKSNQINIGFALETNNEAEHASSKLKKKNFDFIVLNSLADKGAGFGIDTNKVTLMFNNGTSIPYEVKHKRQVAKDICNAILSL